MSAEDHGSTCADSPFDHYCGESFKTDEADQGVTWREWDHIQTEKLQRIRYLHVKVVGSSGMTDGTCAECSHPWPCQTVHIANGWGDGEDDCYATGWCHHASVKVEQIYAAPPQEEGTG